MFSVFAGLLLFGYLLWSFRSWKAAIVITAIAALPIYLSLERASQFLTIDEMYIIREPLQIGTPHTEDPSQWKQWRLGALRTTDTAVGVALVPVRATRQLVGLPAMTEIQSDIFIKNLHWLMGFIALLWILDLLNQHFVSDTNRQIHTGLFIITALLLPTESLALKIFNYDLLSMLLETIALLYLVIAVTRQSILFAFMGTVTAFLATQEKFTAAPSLILAVIIAAYLTGALARRHRHGWLLVGLFAAISVAALVGITCVGTIAILQGKAPSASTWQSVKDPFVSWTLAIKVMYHLENSQADIVAPVSLVAMLLGGYLLAAGLLFMHNLFSTQRDLLDRIARKLAIFNVILTLLFLLVGILSTFAVNTYWAPFYPIPLGYYHPPVELNGAVWHYGAATLPEHLLLGVGHAYAVLVNALPTVFWLFLLGTLLISRSVYVRRLGIGVELLYAFGLSLPAVYGIAQVPVGNKYLDLSLLLLGIIICLKVTELTTSFRQMWRIGVGVVFGLLFVLEILPFRPLYAAFRPIWSSYADSEVPVVGKINPSWVGWGEEVMLTGQIIEDACRSHNNVLSDTSCESITLYYFYPGQWLNENKRISVAPALGRLAKIGLSYTKADYYVMNRSAVVQESAPFPDNVKPVFVIGFRGYAQAWVFRGDQLDAAGCRFVYKEIGNQTRVVCDQGSR